MPLANDVPLALANRFKVKVDAPGEIDLGSWAKVEGLDVTFDVVEYRAGDAWNSRWYCPGATKYSTVKLSRAVTADTTKVKDWLSKTAMVRCEHEQDRHRTTRDRPPRLPRRRQVLNGRSTSCLSSATPPNMDWSCASTSSSTASISAHGRRVTG
jgi:hypothetical protein